MMLFSNSNLKQKYLVVLSIILTLACPFKAKAAMLCSEILGEQFNPVEFKQNSEQSKLTYNLTFENTVPDKKTLLDLKPKLSIGEKGAIDHWVEEDGAADRINRYLRGASASISPVAAYAIEGLDSAISKTAGLSKQVMVYRGEILKDGSIPKEVGQTFSRNTFTATALDRNQAHSGGMGYLPRGPNQYSMIYRIRLPVGTRAVYVKGVTTGIEDEVILPRGTKFKIVSTKVLWEREFSSSKSYVIEQELEVVLVGSFRSKASKLGDKYPALRNGELNN
jgi:hypothetical protein